MKYQLFNDNWKYWQEQNAFALVWNVSENAKSVTLPHDLWGCAPDKLYHSYMVLDANRKNIGALMKGEHVWVRVDTFNETGITEGQVFAL